MFITSIFYLKKVFLNAPFNSTGIPLIIGKTFKIAGTFCCQFPGFLANNKCSISFFH